jgi:hypothetical protein
VFPKQVKGLTEGMGVPSSQFVFGTVSITPLFNIDGLLTNTLGLPVWYWILGC